MGYNCLSKKWVLHSYRVSCRDIHSYIHTHTHTHTHTPTIALQRSSRDTNAVETLQCLARRGSIGSRNSGVGFTPVGHALCGLSKYRSARWSRSWSRSHRLEPSGTCFFRTSRRRGSRNIRFAIMLAFGCDEGNDCTKWIIGLPFFFLDSYNYATRWWVVDLPPVSLCIWSALSCSVVSCDPGEMSAQRSAVQVSASATTSQGNTVAEWTPEPHQQESAAAVNVAADIIHAAGNVSQLPCRKYIIIDVFLRLMA
jgi:hypothetical protein